MPVTHVASLYDRTLGELVAEEGARARVLERYGIDYCCHGDRTLGVACGDADLDIAQIAAELQAVEPAPATVVDGGPLALLEHIVATHHSYLDAELPAVDTLAAKVREVHGEHHPELTQIAELVAALHAELEPHLRREERVVFPAIARVVLGGVGDEIGADIAALMSEHEHAGELLRELRSATDSYAVPADGCASYRSLYERLEGIEKDTFRHIHLENNVLFPAVHALLSRKAPGRGSRGRARQEPRDDSGLLSCGSGPVRGHEYPLHSAVSTAKAVDDGLVVGVRRAFEASGRLDDDFGGGVDLGGVAARVTSQEPSRCDAEIGVVAA